MTGWSEGTYLESFLAPFAPYLSRSDITDIYVNRPGELWIEYLGGKTECIENLQLTKQSLSRLARQVAAASSQGINREHPLLAASLPDGSRIQIVLPPATRGAIAIAIRKHVAASLTLDDYELSGAFAASELATSSDMRERKTMRASVSIKAILREAVVTRKNILISGGTGSGKTTLLNALLREIPQDERLIFIEDTAEVRIDHPNAVGLIAARSELGEAAINSDDLLVASLRLRPKRIIVGEIRGRESLTFLRAINTGHQGSISTIHADSHNGAIEQLTLIAAQHSASISWELLRKYVEKSIDVFVHIEQLSSSKNISIFQ